MAEDVNALYASTLERGKNVRKGVEQPQMVEIPFWLYPEKPKWVSGIRSHTTVRDILLSLVRSDSKATFDESDVREKRLFLVEQWRGVEKPLSQSSSILKIWNAWGDERNQVRFVVKKMSSSSTKNVDYASFKNAEKSVKNVEKSMKSVELSDSKRKMRRRRNSVSSAGSFADEPHPRRLAQMSEVEMSQRLIEKTQRLVEMSQVKKDQGDVFDEHIEEMMKIIVTQGKRICEELKRVQQVIFFVIFVQKINQERIIFFKSLI
jgi:Ras association domain-containing protein 9/10